MKRNKKLLLLSLAFILLLGCYGLVTVLTAPKDTIDAPDETISLGITEGLSAMGWKYEDVSVSLLQSDGKWASADEAEVALDQDLVQELVDDAIALYASRVIHDPEDVSVYGFDGKEAVELFFTKNATVTKLTVGNTDPYGTNAYVMLNEDTSKVYLVKSDSLKGFVLTLQDLVQKEELPSFSDVLSIAISGKNQLEIAFVDGGSDQCYTNQYEWFMQQGSDLLPLTTKAVESLTDTLTTLTWGDCISYNADAAALAGYGLDAPALTLSVLCKEGSTGASATLEFGKLNEEADSYYVRLAGSKMVYLMSSGVFETLSDVSYEDLRAMDVLLVDWFNVKDVKISLNGKIDTMELVEVTGTDGQNSLMYDLNDTTIDTKLGSDFLSSISTMVATETGKKADGNAVLTVSLLQRTATERNVLTFCPSGEGYVVQMNGEGDLWITAAQYKTITDAYTAMTK